MAVTVRVDVPAAAPEPTVMRRILVPVPGEAILAGARVALTPLGSPLTDNVIPGENPLPAVVVTVIETDPPLATLALAAFVARVKLGDWVMVKGMI